MIRIPNTPQNLALIRWAVNQQKTRLKTGRNLNKYPAKYRRLCLWSEKLNSPFKNIDL